MQRTEADQCEEQQADCCPAELLAQTEQLAIVCRSCVLKWAST